MSQKFLILGNPENRRVTLFQSALARAGLPPARVIAWLDLLQGRAQLEPAPDEVVRFESPGEDFPVERELIALGASAHGAAGDGARLDAASARALEPDHGRLLYPRQWYLGFREVLARCERALAGHALLMNAPSEIATLFDKRECHARCSEHGVPVPRSLGAPRSYDELRAAMAAAGQTRVFVKLACGSSASGVVALETRGSRLQAHTTVELVREGAELRLYNSLRVRRYTDERDVAAIVDTLAREGVHVEEWLPKAGIDGHLFDLRVVVIGGSAQHTVVRMSKSPLTNLHLGNRRGDVERVRARLGDEAWSALRASAEKAAALTPRTRHVGVDVLVGSSFTRHAVLEINAFGDLLPNVLVDGLDTYGAEIAALTGMRGPRGESKAIFFDLDDTLVDRTGAVRRWLEARGVPRVGDALRHDDRGRSERRAWWQLLAGMAPHLGSAEAIRADFMKTIASFLEPDPEVARTLERLARTHELVLVSNGSGANQRAKLARSGLERFFARVVISGEVGAEKPARAIFERALAGRSPEGVLFVGDDPERDMAGARGAGLRTCWVSRGEEYPEGLPRPDSQVASVVELAP